jgi:predicted nucleic acid-binding protein
VRIFLDTNVLVSAYTARGLCAELLELILENLRGRESFQEFAIAIIQFAFGLAQFVCAVMQAWTPNQASKITTETATASTPR